MTEWVILSLAMAWNVFPVSLGVAREDKAGTKDILLFVFILGMGQWLLFLLGYWLGERFMHLLSNYHKIITLCIFIYLGFRQVQEGLRIRKQNRSFDVNDRLKLSLLAVARGINNVFAGLASVIFIRINFQTSTIVLFFAVVFSYLGLQSKQSTSNILLASLVTVVSGFVFIALGIYAFLSIDT